MKGKNDEYLTWPFKGTINCTLLNQLENDQHHSKNLWTLRNTDSRITKKPDSFRNEIGHGHEQFLAFSEIEGAADLKQYLCSDVLYFRVTSTFT